MKPFHSNSFLAFLLFICGLAGCGGDDCQVVDSYYYLDERAKEIFPYTGNETLYFLHILDGDTTELELVGKGRKRGFNKKPYIGPCDTLKEDLFEYYRYIYKDKQSDELFEIDLTEQNDHPKATRSIVFSAPLIKTYFYYSVLEKDSIGFTNYDLIDELVLNGTSYKSVLRVSYEEDAITQFTQGVTLYFDLKKGFIKVENRITGNVYQLK